MTITREAIKRGQARYDVLYTAIEKMSNGIGSRDAVLALWREVYPDQTWEQCEMSLMMMQRCGHIDGLKIVGGRLVEPVWPRLTEKGSMHWSEMTDPARAEELVHL